ncbi:MAG: sugar nucleotide-binding protein [Bacillota bacterium]|nr:sugar nucleotide-binding protein [Bacillota bacterium]
MSNPRLLILGATGFLGSTIFEFAKKSGMFDVTGTSRQLVNQLNYVSLDVTNRVDLGKTISEQNPSIIIWSLMDQDNEMYLIENGLKNLLEIVDKRTKFLYISTDAFFNEQIGHYHESYALRPTLFNSTRMSNYAKAKLTGEIIVQENHPNHIIIRTGPLYGKDGNNHIEKRTERIIKLICNNESNINIPTNLIKTFVHVEDVANAILELCLKDHRGIIHLGPAKKESYFTFFKKRLQQLGYNNEVLCPVLDDHPNDSSLDTQFAYSILDIEFRAL